MKTAEHFQQELNAANLASSDQKQASFTEQLITKIVDNLQIEIDNIHIRYEDRTSHIVRLNCVLHLVIKMNDVDSVCGWFYSGRTLGFFDR